jgi:hypothetical protein
LNPLVRPIQKTDSVLPTVKPAHDSPPEEVVQLRLLIQDMAAFTECQATPRRESFSFQISAFRFSALIPHPSALIPSSPPLLLPRFSFFQRLPTPFRVTINAQLQQSAPLIWPPLGIILYAYYVGYVMIGKQYAEQMSILGRVFFLVSPIS